MGRVMTRMDYVWWWLGYNTITRLNTDPPPRAYREDASGNLRRPAGWVAATPVTKLTWKGRIRVLFSGYVQIGYVAWLDKEVAVIADEFTLALPPPGSMSKRRSVPPPAVASGDRS